MLPQNECDILVCNVVDFSLAQTIGFISAYTKVCGITDQAAIHRKLKGCQQHFNSQVTRVKRNQNVVRANEEVRFLCFQN
jgi:hypothetical protein